MNSPTPEAFANFSPGFERSENPGTYHSSRDQTLKGFAAALTLSGLNLTFGFISRVVAALQPWAEISERLRRISERLRRISERLPRMANASRVILVKFQNYALVT